MDTTIRRCSAAEIYTAPNADALWAEYAAESALPELGPRNPQVEMYQAMEDAGVLAAFGAFRGDTLVGALALLISVVPHFGRAIATTETYFVRAEDRCGGTGAMLLKAAEEYARSRGAVAFFVSAPAGGRLERVMPRMGYRASNATFVKGLV